MGLVEVRGVSQGLFSRCLQDYYTPAMLGLKTDQEVLGELVRAKLPAVGALMEQLGVLWTLVVSRWFICLFVDVLPVETVLRIWDCLFNEGSKIIFRVALTLIKQHQEFILEATSIPDICDKFKQITKGSFVMECHTFMQVSECGCSRGTRGSVPSPGGPALPAAQGCSDHTRVTGRAPVSVSLRLCPACLASQGFPLPVDAAPGPTARPHLFSVLLEWQLPEAQLPSWVL
nr:growth hormone-regulated TBC protein 1-like [Saimiri boliviensis boliviensis]